MNRAEAQRDARRQKVAVLYLSGKVQSEIAQSLKVSQQVVSYDLKQCREEWQTSMLVAMGDIKARELAKIDLMEAEA